MVHTSINLQLKEFPRVWLRRSREEDSHMSDKDGVCMTLVRRRHNNYSLDTESKILPRIVQWATVNLWLVNCTERVLHAVIPFKFSKFAALNSAHKTSFSLGGVSFLYYMFWWRHHCVVSCCVWRSYTSLFNSWFSHSFSNFPRFFSRPSLCL